MFRLLFLLLIVVVVHGRSHKHKDISRMHRPLNIKDIKSRIVGGQETTISAHPYQLLLFPFDGNDTFVCGGSILNKNWAMSAAHCFTDIKSVDVVVGTSKMSSGGRKYKTTKFIVHPKYNGKSQDYDIALIDLRATPMAIDGKTSKATKLPAEGAEIPTNTPVTVSGWGTTKENGDVSETLQAVEVNVVDQATCNKAYGTITERMLCAGVANGGKDSCQGDSGGPLVKSSDSTQVGIVSFGYGCARKGYPGVYTRVATVRKWIKDNTGI